MERIIGIDLGTTNSVVAVVEGGQPMIIPSAEDDPLFPSVVGFTRTGERLVGTLAKRQAVSNPERTVSSIKRYMGTDYTVEIDEKKFTPQEISALILQKIKADVEAYLETSIKKAVITVPAYFNDSERQATKDAGTIAGLEVIRIINEPTASSMAYGLDKIDKTETILVWDLGGGTFDVSILEIGNGVFEVKATCGNMRLGGDDWDQRIMDWVVDEFKKSTGIDLRTDRVAMQRINEASEAAKVQLSTDLSAKINLPFIAADASGPKHLEMELTRQKFQELTADLVDKTEEPALKALEDSGIRKGNINKILLVGGATRMPAIQDKVKKIFGKEPSKEIDPDKVVAMGAAIQGAVLAGEVKEVVLLDVTSLSLGIETTGGMFTRIIDRNSQIPCQKSRIFTTVQDGQSVVEVHILQGEREVAANNKSLGKFELRNIPPAPRGVPQIEVTFEIDTNGIVNVSAMDKATKNKQKITIESPTNLSSEEINRMVKEAAVYAEEDSKRRTETHVRNKAQTEIDTAERTLRELGDRLSMDRIQKIKTSIECVKNSLKTYELDKIEEEARTLSDILYSVSTEVYAAVDKEKEKLAGTEAVGEPVKEVTDEEIFDWFEKK